MAEFVEQGYYLRSWNSEKGKKEWEYFYVEELEKPLIYTYTFPSTATVTKATQKNFSDLNPHKDLVDDKGRVVYRYFHQCFIGVAKQGYYYIWYPYDAQSLKWAEPISDIDSSEVAYIDYERSPFENPEFCLWVTRDQYFGIEPKNTADSAKKPKVRIIAAKIKARRIYKDEFPELYKDLESKKIRSLPVVIGRVE